MIWFGNVWFELSLCNLHSELRLVSTKQTLESSEFYNRFRENRFEGRFGLRFV